MSDLNVIGEAGGETRVLKETSSSVAKPPSSSGIWKDYPKSSGWFTKEDTGVEYQKHIGHLAHKDADESVTNSTTLQSDDHLTVTVGASKVYHFRAVLFVTSSSSTAGFKVALGGTATVTSVKAEVKIYDDTTSTIAAVSRVTALGSSVGVVLTAGNNHVEIEGAVEISAAGTFLIQWAQQVADAVNAVTVQRNSYLELVFVK
jgi:hypothetical protein